MSYKILVVDDEPDMGPLITGIFRLRIKRGELTFTHAENGAEALKVLDEDDQIDLILTDINMPVMDGLAFLGKLKERGALQKAIVISAYNDLKNIRTAMNEGAFDFITKPIDSGDLKATIEKGINEMESVYNNLKTEQELEAANKEKERMILEQNERLEIQVEERTKTIIEQKVMLEVKNREIVDSIHYAKNLQESILPPVSLFHNIVPDGFLLYLPKDIVSGDFYWFGKFENKKVIVAADCTGHGVAGALMSMMGISLLNQFVGDEEIDAARILKKLNDAVVRSKGTDEEKAHVGMDLAMIVIDEGGSTLQYAGANRPLWIIREGAIDIHKPDKSPVGGHHGIHIEEFTNHKINISGGDTLYIFTDGFADQFGGDNGKKMMTRKFRNELISIQEKGMGDQAVHLREYFNDWKGTEEQVDDVLVIGIRI